MADCLARKRAGKDPVGQIVGIPFSVRKRILKLALEKDHVARWKSITPADRLGY